ncbi:MAG: aspartate kinase, partial [Anaerolineae bacterium]|nr:aspartate kinase [Anaerolineae bacterium]
MRTVTMKFGGTSVGSPEAVSNAVNIVREAVEGGERVVVVLSAMSGVTDSLLNSIRSEERGNKWGYLSTARKIRDLHEDTLNILLPPSRLREKTIAQIGALMDEYVEICNAISVLGEATPRIKDAIVSFGERMSVRLVAAILSHLGINAVPYEAGEFLITDGVHQKAAPLWDETQTRIEQKLIPLLNEGITPIITGFIGKSLEGAITTLGRGGSDFSGAIFAAYTSDELVIWTDVDGVMTADPRLDNRARVLPHVSYQEVGELAFYGAKVLHPKTILPAVERGIAIRVL